MWNYERAELYLMLLGAPDRSAPKAAGCEAQTATRSARSELLSALLRLRALGCQRARLRRLRGTLAMIAAISGCIPALTPLLPRPLAALTIVWAAPALACLLVFFEEQLLARRQRHIRRRVSHARRAPRSPLERNAACTE